MVVARSRSEVADSGDEGGRAHDDGTHGIRARHCSKDRPQAAGQVREDCKREVGRRVAESSNHHGLQELDGLCLRRWCWPHGHDRLGLPYVAPL